MPASSISCSVVTYHNDSEQVAGVLHSINSTPVEVVTHLIDNSAVNTLAEVARRFGANYHHCPDNIGFGAAHNIAISSVLEYGSTYHLIVNPDITFGADVLPALRAYMDDHPDIGLIMPDIRYENGDRQYLCKLLPRPADLFMRRFLPGLYRQCGWLDEYEMRDSGYDKIMDIPALSGCFMFLRTSLFEKIGKFDERFFMYMEDVDLCRRIGKVARTVYYPEVSVTHGYAKGSYRNLALLGHHVRSAIRYFNKWGWFLDAERSTVNRAASLQMKRPISRHVFQGGK
jgi:GT2 family glycosyltransferase